MSFARVAALHLLWLLPLVLVGLVLDARRRARDLERLADTHLLARLTGEVRPGVRFLRGACVLLALGLLIVALAGPRWGAHYEEVSRKGVDIMLVFDVSPSMLVEDVKPSRLERARREVLDFLTVIRGDRVGLVAFSGAAFVQCPLTLDYEALSMFLGQLEPGLIPVTGTDLGEAIDTAIGAFDDKEATDKVLLLITDGEDNEGKGMEAAARARAKGVKIFVFGIGQTEGGPVPAEKGGFAEDEQGRIVLSRLDEAGLERIASISGGRYVRAVTGDLDLDLVYFAGIKSRTQDRELASGKIQVAEERFAPFVGLALVLLLLEGLLRERTRPGAGPRAGRPS